MRADQDGESLDGRKSKVCREPVSGLAKRILTEAKDLRTLEGLLSWK